MILEVIKDESAQRFLSSRLEIEAIIDEGSKFQISFHIFDKSDNLLYFNFVNMSVSVEKTELKPIIRKPMPALSLDSFPEEEWQWTHAKGNKASVLAEVESRRQALTSEEDTTSKNLISTIDPDRVQSIKKPPKRTSRGIDPSRLQQIHKPPTSRAMMMISDTNGSSKA